MKIAAAVLGLLLTTGCSTSLLTDPPTQQVTVTATPTMSEDLLLLHAAWQHQSPTDQDTLCTIWHTSPRYVREQFPDMSTADLTSFFTEVCADQ